MAHEAMANQHQQSGKGSHDDCIPVLALPFRVAHAHIHEDADATHPLGLCACCERPCRRAAEKRDELASPHGLPSVRGYTLLHRDRNAAFCITANLSADYRDGSFSPDRHALEPHGMST